MYEASSYCYVSALLPLLSVVSLTCWSPCNLSQAAHGCSLPRTMPGGIERGGSAPGILSELFSLPTLAAQTVRRHVRRGSIGHSLGPRQGVFSTSPGSPLKC